MEEIKGSPFVPSRGEIFRCHLLTQIPISQILRKLNRVSLTTIREFDAVDSERFGIMNSFAVKIHNNRIYVVSGFNVKHNLLLTVLSQIDMIDKSVIDLVWEKVDALQKKIGENDSLYSIIRDYYDQIQRNNSQFSVLRFFNEDEFKKACRKNKVLYELKDGNLSIIVPNVKVGNELEGYLHYKKIQVALDKVTLDVISVRFYFSTFDVSTDELSLVGNHSLHPHVHKEFCWGNRDKDYDLYSQNHAYSYLIDVIVDSLKSYNPENPFRSVKQIAIHIGQIKKKLDDMHSAGFDFNIEHSQILQAMWNAIPKCSICNEIMQDDNKHCYGYKCQRNPDANITCKECARPTELGKWHGKLSFYIRKCTNDDCATHTYKYTKGDFTCNHCGTSDYLYKKYNYIKCSCDIKQTRYVAFEGNDGNYIPMVYPKCKVCGLSLMYDAADKKYYCIDSNHGWYQYDINGNLLDSFKTRCAQNNITLTEDV